MYDVKLSYSYFLRGAHKEHHMFAFMDGPFTIGEHSSDFLGFFGFGSSNVDGNAVSPLMRKTEMFFPIKVNPNKTSTERLAVVVKLLNKICDVYDVGDQELETVIRYFFIAEEDYEGYVISDTMLLKDIGIINPTHADKYVRPVHLGVCCGVDRNGMKFFGIEIPDINLISGYTTESVDNFDEFNWELSTQVSVWDNVKGILNKMMKHRFGSKSLEDQNNYLRTLKEKISHISNYSQ